jgi:hypothetical protein
MAGGSRGGIQWFLGAGLFIAAALAGVGGSLLAADDDYLGWFIAAGWVLGVTLLGAVWYFGLHGWILSASEWRERRTAEIRARRSTAQVERAGPRHLEIIEARYGASGLNGVDVRATVSALIIDGRVSAPVGNDLFGPDPNPGFVKELKVVFTTNGGVSSETRTFAEGTTASFPQ